VRVPFLRISPSLIFCWWRIPSSKRCNGGEPSRYGLGLATEGLRDDCVMTSVDGAPASAGFTSQLLPAATFWEENSFADCRKSLILLGERAGDRTQDPVIKSHVLYRLSYALT
jgi:hypothetical protein